jgi:hypothetical protein
MIRFDDGTSYLLITQDDHARMAARFAERLGGPAFAPVTDRAVLDGVALHDCGWPLHDDEPTLNRDGLPLSVLEISMDLAVRVWAESARRASEGHPYTGLLVSLHVMRLSGLAAQRGPQPHERANSREELFLLNQFQQGQIELQEELRTRLGLRIDLPRALGLVKEGVDEREDLLRYHYDLVRFMDGVSLELCSGRQLFPTHADVRPAAGAKAITVRSEHPALAEVALDPWPFAVPRIEEQVPCRRVPRRRYRDDAEFRGVYAAAPREQLAVAVRPAGSGG